MTSFPWSYTKWILDGSSLWTCGLGNDHFQLQSSLGWQDLEYIKLRPKQTIIWSHLFLHLFTDSFIQHSLSSCCFPDIVIAGQTVPWEKGGSSQFSFIYFWFILFKTLTLSEHNQLSISKREHSWDTNTKSGTSYRNNLRESLELIVELTTSEGEKGDWVSSHLWFQIDDIKSCKLAITIDWADIPFSHC